jgi:hypothetical protein
MSLEVFEGVWFVYVKKKETQAYCVKMLTGG